MSPIDPVTPKHQLAAIVVHSLLTPDATMRHPRWVMVNRYDDGAASQRFSLVVAPGDSGVGGATPPAVSNSDARTP
jgi:hypothetical protein